ncbi:response regulator transcription factor [Dictyobacter arantiisoli]|uniref:DNA-binding response regulator n=1 Tax=Dictyobacter arantiisoli TaxID=2014874 RepID=A0A5A5T7S2_9CHLR|nr:response regulator transcription factor [Dictyobacter arantiisoli]GCF06984.1 DNA-binding response regulator [Dictyobacter arantiisoli]
MTTGQRTPIRVAIVDDHVIVREGLRLILETGEGIDVVGDAANGREALELAANVSPEVMLMDLRMPEMDGIEALTRIRGAWPAINVIILTTYNGDELMFRGLHAGARGYLLKDVSRETLLDAVRSAARGETLLQPEIMKRILLQGPTSLPTSDGAHRKIYGILTERELTILAAVARGERSKEIAASLSITERTVRGHLTNIYTKLGVDSRAAAVAVAVEHSLLLNE